MRDKSFRFTIVKVEDVAPDIFGESQVYKNLLAPTEKLFFQVKLSNFILKEL